MKKEPLVAVIILTCNQKEFTLTCLDSLGNCSYSELAIIVVDNNSSDDTATSLGKDHPYVHLVRSPVNAGVAGGRNLGIEYAERNIPYEYLLILDNDTTVERDFLQPMVEFMEENTQVGVVSPKIYLMDEKKILDQAGGSIVNLYTGSTAKRGFGEYDRGQYDTTQTQKCLPCGACSLSRRSVIVECNGLDEVFNPYGFEDLDYSLRVKKAGYLVGYVPKSVIHHKGSKTGFSTYTQEYTAIKGKHLKTFMKRHAAPYQMLCFNLLLPLLGMRTLFREARKGNIKAVLKMVQSYISN